jgi:hypothetical protein
LAVHALRRALHALDEWIAHRRSVWRTVTQHVDVQVAESESIEMGVDFVQDVEWILLGDQPELNF